MTLGEVDMKEKFKNDKKSLILMGYSLALVLIFVVGGVVANNSISTLSKRMNAPANPSFNDDALYECIVDEYERESGNPTSYSANLTDAQLQSITKLECKNKGISNVKGLEKLTNLEELNLSNNNVSSFTYYPSGGGAPVFILQYLTKIKKFILDNNSLQTEHYGLGNSYLSDLEYLSIKNNQISRISLNSNPNLEYLDVSNNQLKGIDLNSNNNLIPSEVDISGNDFETDIYVINDKKVHNNILVSSVKPPSSWSSSYQRIWYVQWTLPENDVASLSVDASGYKITTKGVGNVTATGSPSNNSFNIKCNIHSVEVNVNDEKYETDGNKYIWVGSDATKSEEQILSNVSIKNNASNDVEYHFSNGSDIINDEVKLSLEYNGSEFAQVPVYGGASTSDLYDVDADYMLYNDNPIKVSGDSSTKPVTVSKGLSIFKSNEYVNIKGNGALVKSYLNVNFTSSKYDLSIDKDYTWIGTQSIDTASVNNKTTCRLCYFIYNSDNSTVSLYYNKSGRVSILTDPKLKTWDVIGWSSDYYDLDNAYSKNIYETNYNGRHTDFYINVKGNKYNKDKIRITGGATIDTDPNPNYALQRIVYKGEVIKQFDYVSFTSTKYDEYFHKDYIDVGAGNFDTSNFVINNGSDYSSYPITGIALAAGSTDVYELYYNEGMKYKQWKVINYKSDKYNLEGDYIYVGSDTSIEDIRANINTNIDIRENDYNQLEFIYDGEVIKTMDIIYCNSDYYDLSKDYIFAGSASNEYVKEKININESTSSLNIEGNNLVLRTTEGEKVKSWELVRCYADGFEFGKNYVVQKPTYSLDSLADSFNTPISDDLTYVRIGSSTGEHATPGYKIVVLSYKGEEISLPLLTLQSNTYNLEKVYGGEHSAYVYLGTHDIDTSKVILRHGTSSISATSYVDFDVTSDDDYMTASIDGIEIFKWRLVRITSDYDIRDHVIFVNDQNIDMNKLYVNWVPDPTTKLYLDGNKVSFGNTAGINEETWNIVKVTSNDYYIGRDTINCNPNEFDESKVNIQVPNGVNYTHSYSNEVYTITISGDGWTVTKTYQIKSTGFADGNLYKCVVDAYNSKHGTEISEDDVLTNEQLATINSLNCDGTEKEDSKRVRNTSGIEKLTGLTSLNLTTNHITNIDLSRNTNLTILKLGSSSRGYNEITSLDLSHNTALQGIDIPHNKIGSLNVSNLSNLKTLDAYNNELTNINLPAYNNMTGLMLANNQLTSVDVSHNSILESLKIQNNKLTSIDVSNNTALQTLNVTNNELTSLDLSHNTSLLTDGRPNRELKIGDNDYRSTMNVTVGTGVAIESPVKLPTHINWDEPSYVVDDSTYAAIRGSVVIAKKKGTFEVTGIVADKYSVKININASGDYDLDIEDGVIKNVPEFTQLSEIADKFGTDVTVTITDKDDNPVNREAWTGDKIVVTYSSGDQTTYMVSVLGDVTGDGKVTIPDVSKLYSVVLGETEFEDLCYRFAGDVTKDGNILISDVSKLYSAVLGEIVLNEGEVS